MSANQQSQPPEENSKMDALVKVVLVFFISLLSFSVGTFVGKQVSDSDHRRAELEGDHGGREVASAHGEHHGDSHADSHGDSHHGSDGHSEHGDSHDKHADSHDQPSDEAVEDLASEFLHDSGHESDSKKDENGYSSYKGHENPHGKKEENQHHKKAAHHDPHQAPAPQHEEEKAHHSPKTGTMEAAKQISHGHAPTTGKKEAHPPREPSNTLPQAAHSATGKFTVQVASYGSETDAKRHASELKKKGWNAFYVPAEVKGQTWYRVSVGLFEESRRAQAFRSQFLKESGLKDALVVKVVQ